MSNIVSKRGVMVKKAVFLFGLLTFLMCLCISVAVSADSLYYNDQYNYYDAGEIGLKINGKTINGLTMHPVIINDYTMVPLRDVFEALGNKVIWHDATCQAEISGNGKSLIVKIGDRNTYINNNAVWISEPQPMPMLIGKGPDSLKTMVPVRFIAEKLGYSVKWDDPTRTVLISSNDGSASSMPDSVGSFGAVSAESDGRYDYIYISTRYGISPNITKMSSPDRVVLDFPGASFLNGGGSINLKGVCTDSVRYANFESNARVVLDIKNKAQVAVMSSERGIMIRAERSENDIIFYDAFSERVYFDKSYVGNGKDVTNGYKVLFTNMKLASQKIEIHDGKIYEIIIEETDTGCYVTVDGSNSISYTAEKGFYKTDKQTMVNPETSAPSTPPSVSGNSGGGKCVVLDAGHGGNDPGAVGYNSEGTAVAYESHINLAITRLLGQKLQASGINVVYTRSEDVYASLKDRTALSDNVGATLFVSVHCNSIDKPEIEGTQVYYHPASEKGTVLAKNIYSNMVSVTGLKPMNLQNGSHLYVIRSTVAPAALVECAFISNEHDRNYLMSSSGQEAIATAIYQGIMATLN